MNKEIHRMLMIDKMYYMLGVFCIYAMVNGIGIIRFDINGMHTFLKFFNQTVMWGTLLLVMYVSIKRDKLIKGKLW